MRYLLDTAVWCNLTTQPQTVPARVRELVEAEECLGLASVSLLEAAILHRLGRLALTGTLADFFAAALARNIRVLEVTAAVAAETNALPPDFQGDPFDRTVVATARALRLVPITTDLQIRDHGGLERVEYYPFKPGRCSPPPAA